MATTTKDELIAELTAALNFMLGTGSTIAEILSRGYPPEHRTPAFTALLGVLPSLDRALADARRALDQADAALAKAEAA